MTETTAPFSPSQLREQLMRNVFATETHFALGGPVGDLIAERTATVDRVVIAAFGHTFAGIPDVALVATGGFGRQELLPQSDIDVLLIVPDPIRPEVTRALEALLSQFWNLGLQASHIVRNHKACIEEAARDLSSATALFEARFLAGDRAAFERMVAALDGPGLWPPAEFLRAKRQEQKERHARYNDTAFNLEPNIKEGPGGLRDLHALQWVAKRAFGTERIEDFTTLGITSAEEQEALLRARDVLWLVRFGLHRLLKRREERLLFDHQRELAAQFGFQDTNPKLAVERFMQGYYRASATVRRLSKRVWERLEARIDPGEVAQVALEHGFHVADGRLHHADLAEVDGNLDRLVQALRLLAQASGPLKPAAALAGVLGTMSARLGEDHLASLRTTLPNLLREKGEVMNVVEALADIGLLGRLVPAFEQVSGRMQYDMFHAYTVDQHTLFVMHNLAAFARESTQRTHPLACEVRRRIRKPELLLLAGLFHDIAKGRGGDHSELGEVEARAFGQAAGLSATDIDLVAWLVREHLTMSVTAQKQDIGDPQVVHRFASVVKDWERLDYLYLLTVADISGTNPKLWNGWKDRLLSDLYQATRYALRRGLEHPVHESERVAELKREALALLAKAGVSAEAAQGLWAEYPDESLLRFTPAQVAWQTEVVLGHAGRPGPRAAVRSPTEHGTTEVFVYSADREGIFATITAVLDRLQLSVLEARIVTSRQGHVLDTFQVLDAEHRPLTDADRLAELVTRLEEELGKPELALTPARRAWTRQQKHFQLALKLDFRDDEAAGRTELGLVCSDRPGLLAQIAQVFRAVGLAVHDARIATFGERVEDIFLLSTHDGRPLSIEQRDALSRTLAHELNPFARNRR